MRILPHMATVVILAVSFLFTSSSSIANASVWDKGPATTELSDGSQFYYLDGRLLTLRQIGNRAQLSIDHAQPGDLVSLTDRTGWEWVAVVPVGADHAATPWVTDAVRGRARTIQGSELYIPVPSATTVPTVLAH